MNTTETIRDTARHVAETAANSLTAVFESGGEVFVRTPLMYPSGSSVVVIVRGAANHYYISDYGLSASEADAIGADKQFIRSATMIAARSGLEYGKKTLSATGVSKDQVAGAIAVVANAAKDAVELAALRLSEKREHEAADRLVARLISVFGKNRVHKDPEVRGASSHPWRPMALVEGNGHRATFQYVKRYANSVYATATMFHDIGRLTDPPSRIAVADRVSDLGDFVGILSQAGSVVGINDPDKAYKLSAA